MSRRLVARGDKTELTIVYTLIFVAPVNYFIRSAIERGAEGGLAKNFKQLLEVLGKKVPVQDAEQAAAAAAAQVRCAFAHCLSGSRHGITVPLGTMYAERICSRAAMLL